MSPRPCSGCVSHTCWAWYWSSESISPLAMPFIFTACSAAETALRICASTFCSHSLRSCTCSLSRSLQPAWNSQNNTIFLFHENVTSRTVNIDGRTIACESSPCKTLLDPTQVFSRSGSAPPKAQFSRRSFQSVTAYCAQKLRLQLAASSPGASRSYVPVPQQRLELSGFPPHFSTVAKACT